MTPIKTAIVPVAGLGTRLLPLTAAVPKELLPLAGKPTLHYIAEELGRIGVNHVVLVSSHEKQQIAQYFECNPSLEEWLRQSGKTETLATLWSQSPFRNMKFTVKIQKQQRGLGDAVLCGQPDSDQPVIVALGDCVIGLDGRSNLLERMAAVFETRSADIVIAFERVPIENVNRFGIAQPIDSEKNQPVFRLENIVEKPAPAEAPSNLAVAARYIFSPQIFDELRRLQPGKNDEIQLTDAIQHSIQNEKIVYGVCLKTNEHRYDVGNIDSYTEAFVKFAMADPKLRETVLRSISQDTSHP